MIQKIHCHEMPSITTPPISGPLAIATPPTAPQIPSTQTVEHHYDAAASRIDGHYRFEREGRVEQRDQHSWAFTAGEIQRMLAAAGLRTVRLFGGADRSPYALGSPQLIVVAERSAQG